MWNGYGVRSNLASSGEPSPPLHVTTLTTDRKTRRHQTSAKAADNPLSIPVIIYRIEAQKILQLPLSSNGIKIPFKNSCIRIVIRITIKI